MSNYADSILYGFLPWIKINLFLLGSATFGDDFANSFAVYNPIPSVDPVIKNERRNF